MIKLFFVGFHYIQPNLPVVTIVLDILGPLRVQK